MTLEKEVVIIEEEMGTDIDAPMPRVDLFGKQTMSWEDEVDIEVPFYSKCEVCDKYIYNHDGRMPYINAWGEPFNSERFCTIKCCKKHLKKEGIKHTCKNCKITFYSRDDLHGKYRQFCSDKCKSDYEIENQGVF